MAGRVFLIGTQGAGTTGGGGPPPGSGGGPDGQVDQYWNPNANSWIKTANMPGTSGDFLGCVAYDDVTGRIYANSNTDTTLNSYFYYPPTDSWTTIASLPSGKAGSEGLSLAAGGVIWYFGGYTTPFGSPVDNVLSYKTSQTVGSDVYVDETAGRGIQLPVAAGDMFGCRVGRKFFLFGGMDGDPGPPTNSTAYDTALVFDTANPTAGTNGFTAIHSLPAKLAMAGCCYLNDGDTILIWGGSLDGTPNTSGSTGVYAYSISGNTYTPKGAFPISVAAMRGTMYNGKVLAAGGFPPGGFQTGNTGALSSVYTYSGLAGDTWSIASGNLGTLYWPVSSSALIVLPDTNALYFGTNS